jgi:hypothetical protein
MKKNMPIYTFRNKKTGTEITENMSMARREEKLASGEWEQVITGIGGMISDSKSTMTRAGSEWQSHLKRIKKGAGSGNTVKV